MNEINVALVLVVIALLCIIAYLAVDAIGRRDVIAAQYEYIAASQEYQDALTELVASLQKELEIASERKKEALL